MADDMLQRGARMIERTRAVNLSHAVGYKAGAANLVELYATTDRTDFQLTDEAGVGIVDRSRDFLFARAAFVAAVGRLPVVGDLVTETIDSQAVRYEVKSFGGEPAYGFDDTMNLRLRVHTARV